MLKPHEIQNGLQVLVRGLDELGVTVTLADDEISHVTIAQLRNQHIVINTRRRDGLNCIFTVAHLFGHLIQFLSYEKYVHLTSRVEGPKPVTVDAEFRRAFYDYEVEAFGIGKGLMLECFQMSREIDSKYTLFLEADFAHFWHFITTGERGDAASFNQFLAEAYKGWTANQRFLTPLAHPKSIRLSRPASVDVM
jgi:hypothetical protein